MEHLKLLLGDEQSKLNMWTLWSGKSCLFTQFQHNGAYGSPAAMLLTSDDEHVCRTRWSHSSVYLVCVASSIAALKALGWKPVACLQTFWRHCSSSNCPYSKCSALVTNSIVLRISNREDAPASWIPSHRTTASILETVWNGMVSKTIGITRAAMLQTSSGHGSFSRLSAWTICLSYVGSWMTHKNAEHRSNRKCVMTNGDVGIRAYFLTRLLSESSRVSLKHSSIRSSCIRRNTDRLQGPQKGFRGSARITLISLETDTKFSRMSYGLASKTTYFRISSRMESFFVPGNLWCMTSALALAGVCSLTALTFERPTRGEVFKHLMQNDQVRNDFIRCFTPYKDVVRIRCCSFSSARDQMASYIGWSIIADSGPMRRVASFSLHYNINYINTPEVTEPIKSKALDLAVATSALMRSDLKLHRATFVRVFDEYLDGFRTWRATYEASVLDDVLLDHIYEYWNQ